MNCLVEMIASERIPHALLFSGGDLSSVAKKFALDLLGKYPHPDLREYFPEGKTGIHSIQTIRQLTNEVAFVPYQAKCKLFIIYDADRMLPTSSNALLKTLEEPAARTVILLLTTHPERLLPTILSRCQKIAFPQKNQRVEHKILEVLAGTAPLFDEDEDAEKLVETVMLWYRDRFLLTLKGGEAYLTYPEHRLAVEQTPFFPLERVEEVLKQVRLGLERSIKLPTCLEMLYYKLNNPNFSKIL